MAKHATCLYSDIESHEYSRHPEPPAVKPQRTNGREAVKALDLRVQSTELMV